MERLIESQQNVILEVVKTKREMETLKKKLEVQTLFSLPVKKTFGVYKLLIELKDQLISQRLNGNYDISKSINSNQREK